MWIGVRAHIPKHVLKMPGAYLGNIYSEVISDLVKGLRNFWKPPEICIEPSELAMNLHFSFINSSSINISTQLICIYACLCNLYTQCNLCNVLVVFNMYIYLYINRIEKFMVGIMSNVNILKQSSLHISYC